MYLVKNGLIVSGKGINKGDILIGDGIIQKIGEIQGNVQTAKLIDASGKYVLPGIIDAHCHPVYADKMDTFSRSAAFGGVTTVIPFIGNVANWGYSGKTSAAIERLIEEAERISYLDFSAHSVLVCRLPTL
jgi:dihydropyrimidinase